MNLLELVLKNNIFEFDEELFIQLIGTAMGTRPAPSYANIFMARNIDKNITRIKMTSFRAYQALKYFAAW